MEAEHTRTSFLAVLAGFAALGAAPRGRVARVRIKDLAFTPKALHVAAGTTVIWTNEDDVVHTVTSGVSADDGRWTSSPGIAPGRSFSHTFAVAGTYPYFCKPHFYNDAMHATIVVT